MKWPPGSIIGRDKYYPNEVFEMLEPLGPNSYRNGGWIAVRHFDGCGGCKVGAYLEEHHSSIEPLTDEAREMIEIAARMQPVTPS